MGLSRSGREIHNAVEDSPMAFPVGACESVLGLLTAIASWDLFSRRYHHSETLRAWNNADRNSIHYSKIFAVFEFFLRAWPRDLKKSILIQV